MNGMVLDITRWLDEHPGGSTIIPEQALGVDCTVFFEIYHASRQSYLYLKEFYIGELALEDRKKVPLPKGYKGAENGEASEAFMEQLRKVTTWRLDINEMPAFEIHKSF
jgi:cytochrome b involved in lipid metabolism